jgi:hypothetical protein
VPKVIEFGWLFLACGLVVDISGFAILMAELVAAQRTEFHKYHSSLTEGIDALRADLREFIDRTYAKLKELIPEERNPYQALRELLDIFFSESLSRDAFDQFTTRYGLKLKDEDEIGLIEHINFNLAIAEARSAWETLDQDRMVEGLSAIERKWFADWYPLPEIRGGAVLSWYQDEMWGPKKPRWLSDNNVYFRSLNFEKKALLKRRIRFYIGATLVVIGFLLQFTGTLIEHASRLPPVIGNDKNRTGYRMSGPKRHLTRIGAGT